MHLIKSPYRIESIAHTFARLTQLLVIASIGLYTSSCDDNDDDTPDVPQAEKYMPEDPIDIGYTAEGDTFTIMTWNVGHWSWGKQQESQVNDTTFDFFYDGLLKCFKDIKPHVVGVQELTNVMIDTESHPRFSFMKMMECMGFSHQFQGETERPNQFIIDAIASMMPIGKSSTLDYKTNLEYYNTWNRQYYYILSSIIVGETEIPVIVTHLSFSTAGDTCAIGQIEELVAATRDMPRAIVLGDFNTRDLATMGIFEQAGMTVCNYGDRKVMTWHSQSPTHYDDNIVLKGLSLVECGSYPLLASLSDHDPFWAKVTLDVE